MMSSCIGVNSHIEIIFKIISLHNHIKVSRLKFTVKSKSMFLIWIHSFIFSRFFNSSRHWGKGTRRWELKSILPFSRSGKGFMKLMSVDRSESIINNPWAYAKFIRFWLFKMFIVIVKRNRRSILRFNIWSPSKLHVWF